MRNNLQLGTYALGALVVGAGLVLAYQFVEPAPPDRIVMATGPEGGVYEAYARRYRDLLALHDVTLELRASPGSVANLELLADEGAGVDLGFAQGGLPAPGEAALRSLGTMFLEPLWVFTRLDPPPRRLGELRGLRLAIGVEGSGTRALASELLRASGIGPADAELAPLTGVEARDALQAGRIDAMFTVTRAGTGGVHGLATAPGVRIVDLAHADGFAQVYHYLEAVTVHAGAIDFRADVPPADVRLVAATANLVARPGLHPALADLVLGVAREAHEEGDLLTAPGRYPSPTGTAFPLAPSAERYYERGEPFLQRYMPFWVATFVERTAVMLIPLATLLVPLVRLLPPLVVWRMRSRVYRWYARLAEIERRALQGPQAEAAAARHELERVDAEISRIKVPLSYSYLTYRLRGHLDLVKARVGTVSREAPERMAAE